jgi:lipopolysaccharide export system ATP-binding protein
LLILLDEPFAAVDPITTEDIRRNIRELAQQGIGILLTDHNVREVLKITDRSYLIKDGRVVTKGTPQQLINDPIAIREYLGTTFSDNIFGGQPLPPEKTLAENDPMKRMVDHLQASDTARAAAERILASGKEAIPALVDALGRPQVELRIRAYDLLKRIVAPTPLVYDPNAGDAVRARQLAALRSQLKV